jgi:hypothetical protein
MAMIPGLSTFLALSTDVLNTPALVNQVNNGGYLNYYYAHPHVSLGIDCSGLAHRAAKYSGSTYWVAGRNGKEGARTFAGRTFNDGTGTWGPVEATHVGSYQMHPGGWDIENPDNLQKQTPDRQAISRAVPGDLLVKDGHVMIIQNIRIPVGSDVITSYDQVDLIHATMGDPDHPTWQVQHDTWNIVDNRATYQLRRYR